MISVHTSASRSKSSPNAKPGSQENIVACAPPSEPLICVASFHETSVAMNDMPNRPAPIGPPNERSCGPNAHKMTAPKSGSSQMRYSSG